MLRGRRSPEVVEADLVKKRSGLERRDVAAQLRGLLVRAQDHRDRVPADERADAALHRGVPREWRLLVGGDGVDVGGRPHVLNCGALVARTPDYALDQVMRPLRAVLLHDGVEGLEPLLSLDCIDIGHFEQTTHETHMAARDRENLGMDRPITRRDFLDGVAIGAGALTLGGFLRHVTGRRRRRARCRGHDRRAPRTSPGCAA